MGIRVCQSCRKKLGKSSKVCARCRCHKKECMCAFIYRVCLRCGGHLYLDGHGEANFPKRCKGRCFFGRKARA